MSHYLFNNNNKNPEQSADLVNLLCHSVSDALLVTDGGGELLAASAAFITLADVDMSQLHTLSDLCAVLTEQCGEDVNAKLMSHSERAVLLTIAEQQLQVRSSEVDGSVADGNYRVLHFEPIGSFDIAKADFLGQALDSVEQGLVVLDENRQVIALNNIALGMGGWLRVDIIGKSFTGFDLVDLTDMQSGLDWWQKVDRFGSWQDELSGVNYAGHERCFKLQFGLIENQSNASKHYIITAQDVTEGKKAEDELERLTYYDSVTGLPNRAFFQENLRRDILRANRLDQTIAILSLNIDRFKFVNDYLGHHGGDELLRQVATRLLSIINDADMVSRHGSDEFSVALIAAKNRLEVEQTAERIIELLSAPYTIFNREVTVTACIGICIVPDHADTLNTAMQAAGVALASAREQGKGCFGYADIHSSDVFGSRTKLEADLRRGIKNNQLELYFQPQNNSQTGKITGFEALVRWNHPEMGRVMPDQFIGIAEQSGIIVELDHWVMDKACAQMAQWRDEGLDLVPMSVNLSALNFLDESLAKLVGEVLTKYQLPAHLLDVEITERSVLKDAERTIQILKELNELGVVSSIDDFGTGYSSLSYLKQFPVSRLKIDGSLVQDVAENDGDMNIVKTIIELGQNLSLEVIAEGVETEVQRMALAGLGCKLLQGYLYSKPVPAKQAQQYLAKVEG